MSRSTEKTSLTMKLAGTIINTLNDTSEVSKQIAQDWGFSLTDGDGANECNRIWMSSARELAAAASETIDLYDFGSLDIGAGAGKDALGQSLLLDEIVAIGVRNRSTSTGRLVVGNDGTTAAFNSIFADSGTPDTAAITLKPGAVVVIGGPGNPGYDVTDTSNHLLKIAAAGGDVDYDIIVIGRAPEESSSS